MINFYFFILKKFVKFYIYYNIFNDFSSEYILCDIFIFNTAFKLIYNLIHNNILLILIIYNYKRIFQLIIFNIFKHFESFNEFFKFFNTNSIISAQFYIINVVVAL